jgi:hypothetical protein
MTVARNIGSEDSDLAVRDLARRPSTAKRSLALVSILGSLAAAEIANAYVCEISPAIFKFFDTIAR